MKKVLQSIILILLSTYAFAQTPIQSYTWKSVTINGGGYVPGFVFNKAGNNLLYARTDVGGAYRWNHATKSWIPLSDFVTSGNQLGVISIAADPNDSNRVYMATGLYTNSWDPNGVLYSSTNRGDSWTRIEVPFKVGGNEPNRGSGERLQVDPNKSNVLYFGSQKQGLFTSSDYGLTWTKVSTFPKLNCTFVQIDQRSGIKGSPSKDIYVGTYDHFNSADTTKGGLYKSIDGGLTWSYWTGQPEKVEPKSYDNPKISTPAVPNNLGFAGDNIFITMGNDLAPGTSNGYVVRYNKTTNTWTKIYPVGHDSQGGYNGLAIHPTNPNIIYVGTLGHWWPTSDIIYVSTDAGVTWKDVRQKMRTDLKNTPHGGGMGWLSGLTINPNNPNHAVFGSGNGLTMTYDLTKSITNDSTHWVYENDNFEETVTLDLASPPSGSQLISGLGDIHGFVHLDLSKSPANNFNGGGNTYSVDFAETNPQIIVRTHDGGKRASITKNNGTTWAEFATQATGGSARENYITISPDASKIIWTPSNAVPSYSIDGGVTWTLCSGLGSGVAPKSDRVNSSIFYAIDNSNSSFFKSIDGGKTFTKTAATFPFTGGMSIQPVFGKEGNVWISANENGLYFSNNGGTSFSKITSVSAAYRVTFGKAAPNQNYTTVFIYGKINGEVGLYRSDDMAATWIKINNKNQQFGRGHRCIAGDPKTYGRLYIGTGGRGILYGDTQGTGICYSAQLTENLTICKQSSISLSANIPVTGYTYSWRKDGSPLSSTSSAITISAEGTYEVTATKAGCPTTNDAAFVKSNLLKIDNQTICQGQSITLTVDKPSSYAWLNSSGTALDTTVQNFAVSPAITTDYYVKEIAVQEKSIGLPAYTSGGWGLGGAFDNAQNIATLTVLDDTRLKAISLKVNGAGTKGVIRILDATGNVVVSKTALNLPTGMQEISFDYLLTAGTYKIDAVGTTGSIQFQSDRTNAVFSIPNYINYAPVGWGYGIFFNLKFEVGNTCAATPVKVTVSPAAIPTITAPATSFCTGGSVVLTASAGTSYKWFNGTTQVGTSATYTATTAGSYTVEVTNASGCKATSAVKQITVNALPTATITTPATSICTGGSTVLTASAGTSYKWFNGTAQVGTAATYTVTTAGSYTVEVTNAYGCKATSAVKQITVNALPTATITTPATSICTGVSTVLTASTGTSYKWFNGTTQVGTSSTYTATVAGAYTVEVSNASGCKATSAVTTISVSAAPTATITTPATSFCTGGSVVLTTSAGTSYKWFNGTTQVGTSATYTATTAGAYTVEVSNASGCKATSAVTTITVNTAPTATITTPATSFCTGGSTVLTASGGASYKWFNGTTQVGTAATYTATTAGAYTVEVTNASGCKATSAVTTISVIALPSATITSSATSLCQGESVVLSASTGTSYKWFNGTTQVGTSATYTAIAAGAYTVEVTNASGCKATSAVTTISVNTVPTATITTPATSICTGGSTVLTASAGTSYKWFNGTTHVGTSATYTATAAGSYTVEVTNASGCKATSVATQITVSALPTATITAPATSFCTGGSVVLTASAGSSYKWFNGTTQVGTSSTYTATAAGSYTVEVTNASGCKATSAVTTISVSAAPTASITTPVTSICTGGSTVLTASTGSSYKWFNATTQVGTSATYTATTAGSYTVEVTNASGCKATSAVKQITVNALPTATITTPATSICTGGSVVLTASAGTSYKWFNGTTQVGTSATYTATTAGAYTVEVTNASGCKATSSVTTISVSTAPTATITTPATSICTGGSVILTASAGSSYKWFNGTTQVGASSAFTATTAGMYTVEVTNASGCKATSAVTTISVIALPSATITSSATSLCQGESVVLSASTGTSYKWFNGTTQVGTSSTYTATSAGAYTVEVTNASGCKATSAVTQLAVSAAPTAIITTPATSICTGGSVILTASAGTSYKWFNGTTQVGASSAFTATTAGAYTVEITNASGCKATSAVTVISSSASVTWYADNDNDGKGDPNTTVSSCTKPVGYVAIAGDDCPTDANKTTPGNCGCSKTESSCLDCAGVPNGTATIDVCTICSGGTTGRVPVTDINLCNITTGNLNTNNTIAIKVAPNPFTDNIYLTIPSEATVQLIDATGNLVFEAFNIQSIETSQFANGLYLLRITTKNGTEIIKVEKHQ